jgi:hypothetical protein
MALIGVTPGAEVYFDQPGDVLAIPAGVYPMRRATFVSGAAPTALITLDQADGAVLSDLAGAFGAFGWTFNPTLAPALTWPAGGATFDLGLIATLAPTLRNDGSVPVVQVSAVASPLVVSMSGLASIALSGDAVTPFFNIAVGGALVFVLSECIGQKVANLMIAGPVGALLGWVQDGTAPTVWPSLPGFLGVEANVAKGMAGGGGPTAKLPSPFFGNVPDGCMFWDTDLLAMFQWNGTAWEIITRRTSAAEFLGPFPQVLDNNATVAWPGTTHTSATGRVLVTLSVRAPFINPAGVGFSSFVVEAEGNPGALPVFGGTLVPILTFIASVVPSDATASGATFSAEAPGIPVGVPITYSALLRLVPNGAPTTLIFDGSAATAQMAMTIQDLAP